MPEHDWSGLAMFFGALFVFFFFLGLIALGIDWIRLE